MRTDTVTGVILGLLMVFAEPSQAQESNEHEIDCSQLTTTLQIELCEERWDEEEIRQMIRDEINNHITNEHGLIDRQILSIEQGNALYRQGISPEEYVSPW